MIESGKFYTAKEAAEELNFTVRRIGDLWRAGQFPGAMGNNIETLRIPGRDILNLGQSPTDNQVSTAGGAVREAEQQYKLLEIQRKTEALALKFESTEAYLQAAREVTQQQLELKERATQIEKEIAEKVKEAIAEKELLLDSKIEVYEKATAQLGPRIRELEAANNDMTKQIATLTDALEVQETERELAEDKQAQYDMNKPKIINLLVDFYKKSWKYDRALAPCARQIRPLIKQLSEVYEYPQAEKIVLKLERVLRDWCRIYDTQNPTDNEEEMAHYLVNNADKLREYMGLPDAVGDTYEPPLRLPRRKPGLLSKLFPAG